MLKYMMKNLADEYVFGGYSVRKSTAVLSRKEDNKIYYDKFLYTYLAQLGQIAASPAPWVTSNIPPISCSSLWDIKSPPLFPQPVRLLCERLPAHIISALAS